MGDDRPALCRKWEDWKRGTIIKFRIPDEPSRPMVFFDHIVSAVYEGTSTSVHHSKGTTVSEICESNPICRGCIYLTALGKYWDWDNDIVILPRDIYGQEYPCLAVLFTLFNRSFVVSGAKGNIATDSPINKFHCSDSFGS
jgi:hypothetical protein